MHRLHCRFYCLLGSPQAEVASLKWATNDPFRQCPKQYTMHGSISVHTTAGIKAVTKMQLGWGLFVAANHKAMLVSE